jgi:hypothetical protein
MTLMEDAKDWRIRHRLDETSLFRGFLEKNYYENGKLC